MPVTAITILWIAQVTCLWTTSRRPDTGINGEAVGRNRHPHNGFHLQLPWVGGLHWAVGDGRVFLEWALICNGGAHPVKLLW